MDEGHRQQPVELAVHDRASFQVQRREQAAFRVGEGDERDGRGEDHEELRQPEPDPSPGPGEVPVRGARVAGLLGQPAEARRDLRLVIGRRAAVSLAIGLHRRGQLAGSHPYAGEIAPRRVGGWVLAQPDHGLPRGCCLALVVEAVQGIAVAEQRGPGDRRVLVADGAPEVGDRGAGIAIVEPLAPARDQASGEVGVERALGAQRGVEGWVGEEVGAGSGALVSGVGHPGGRY